MSALELEPEFPTKKICPTCGRRVPVEHGFFESHLEDPPSRVVCGRSGTWAGE